MKSKHDDELLDIYAARVRVTTIMPRLGAENLAPRLEPQFFLAQPQCETSSVSSPHFLTLSFVSAVMPWVMLCLYCDEYSMRSN